MTQNQIAYHNALETERHNKMTEQEAKRHAMIEEELKRRSNELAEQSNTISKEHYERMDAINSQHYLRSDTLNEMLAAETMRSNLQSESIRRQQNAINAASVAETARHAKATEAIESSLAKNTIYKTQADVSYTTANTGLVQARTITEKYQPQYVINQTDLARAKTITEPYQRENIQSGTVRNYIGSISDIIQGIGKLAVLIR